MRIKSNGHLIQHKINDSVTVICYGKKKVWNSRVEAIAFYLEGMSSCMGAERDRYANIYLDLICGKSVCTDGD